MGNTNYVGKTRALISYAFTVQLICAFVFVYAEIKFSHDVAHICHSSCNYSKKKFTNLFLTTGMFA